jgi:peptidoglycan/LPS O-acetylase OafA/YrhL
MLPNAVQVLYPSVPFANQLWSIGVEEQFYLVWPLIIKYIKKHALFLLFIIIAMPVLTAALYYFSNGRMEAGLLLDTVNFLKQFLSLTRIDCMAAGGIAAILLFKQSRIIHFVFHPAVQVANLILLLYIFFTGFYLPYFSNIIHGIIFSVLILNLAANPVNLLGIESRVTNYLGKISYGIYMYHPLGIFLAIKLVFRGEVNNQYSLWLLLYLFAFAFTIIIASVSYKFIEHPLLNIKKRFSPVFVNV